MRKIFSNFVRFSESVAHFDQHEAWAAESKSRLRYCEKTTGPIYLKFWHKFLLHNTIEIQK
jgi:hypothetical protein